MEPTLHEVSLILGYRLYGELEAGDIIIFEYEGELLVKRITACPGETVEHGGALLTVPADCYYVLGDNAENSYDSRYWEDPFLNRASIVAKLIRMANRTV